MKWPNTLTFIRHGESAYNVLKKRKKQPDFVEFKKQFNNELSVAKDENWVSNDLQQKARKFWKEFALGVSDYNTPLSEEGIIQAEKTGEKLLSIMPIPDVIYVSPYLRTRQTLEGLQKNCPELKSVKIVSEERIREQEHGLATAYNDSRIYYSLNPEQALLWKLESEYEYRFLNGENKADVRDRVRSFLSTLIREHAEDNILLISHHLTLLSLRANLERWDRGKFIETDKNEKPINCGVTVYKGDEAQGKNGRLLLEIYNKQLY